MKTTIIRIPIILLLSLTNQVLCDGVKFHRSGCIEMVMDVNPTYAGFLPVLVAVPFAVILTKHFVSFGDHLLITICERNQVVKLTKSPFLDL